MPTGHGSQASADEFPVWGLNVPGAQSWQDDAPVMELKVPTGHASHEAGDDALTDAEKRPAGQAVQF